MRFARLRQSLLYAGVILALFAGLSRSSVPQAIAVREYIRFAVHADFDATELLQKAKGLGSFTARINWKEAVHALAPARLNSDAQHTP